MKLYREIVYEIMVQKGLSKNKLANLIGVSQTAVSSWINGCKAPREYNVILIAKVLNVPVNKISDLEELENVSSSVLDSFQGWGSSQKQNKIEVDDPCLKAIHDIEIIRQEQNRLKTVTGAFMKTMQSMFYVKNIQGEYIVANEAYLKALGHDTTRNITGKKDFDIMPQKNANSNSIQDQDIIKTGKGIKNKTVQLPFFNKFIKWCVMTKVPLRDNKLNIVGVVASLTDITGEYMLQKKEAMLNEAINRSDTAIGITSINASGNRKYVYANDAMCKIFAYSKAEYKKNVLCWCNNVVNEDVEIVKNHLGNTSFREKKISFRYIDRETGKIRNILLRTSGVKDSDLRYTSCFDVTEKVSIDKERENLFTGFSLLTDFIDNIDSAVFISEYIDKKTGDLEYVYRNEKSYEFIGKNEKLQDIYDPAQCDEIMACSRNNLYPRRIIYNIIKKNIGKCTIEEKVWLREVNQKKYIFSIIKGIESN
jgi:predicted transcriptional regulator